MTTILYIALAFANTFFIAIICWLLPQAIKTRKEYLELKKNQRRKKLFRRFNCGWHKNRIIFLLPTILILKNSIDFRFLKFIASYEKGDVNNFPF
jgi:hypothetical protein